MSDKNKKPEFAKYAIAAVAALLIIGVAVTTVMIKAKRKDVIVIDANNNNVENSDNSVSENAEKNKESKTDKAEKTTKATYDRLINANAPNVHLSYYSNGVVDTTGKYKNDDGTPYTYSAHWSWVYLLDNDCKKDNVYLFSWLGKQNNGINDEQKGGSNSRYINFKKINYLLLFFIILL